MIKLWVRILILVAAFFVSVMVSFSLANQTFDDQVIVLGAPTLPRISFLVAGEAVNHSFGHVNEMELTSMRGTITPIPATGSLTVNVEGNQNHIVAIGYEVFTLDGQALLQEGNPLLADDWTFYLDLGGVFGQIVEDGADLTTGASGGQGQIREAVLRITLFTEGRPVYFYTRLVPDENLQMGELLTFTRTFHQNTFVGAAAFDVGRFLEGGGGQLNNGLQTVTKYSDISEVQWAGLAPQIRGEVEWGIYEANPSYTSILATYQIATSHEDFEGAVFNVREFFRVRYGDGEVILQKYHRTVNQVFTGVDIIDDQSIFLGLAPRGIEFQANEEEDVVAFVQERELWVYSKAHNQLALVFTFMGDHEGDSRSNNDQHNIRVINIDEDGNTIFAVYGYMNRGPHEGMVGINVFYYNIETNSVEEKAFISSNQAFGGRLGDAGNRVHYSAQQGIVYFVTGGTLYEIDVNTNRQSVVFEGLAPEQYVFSDNGNYLAWQFDGDRNSATTLRLKDLRTGETHSIFATGGSFIRPLGFIKDDFIYGFLREEDIGRTMGGGVVLPAYRLEIVDTYREVVKTYQDQNLIESVEVEGNQIIINKLNEVNGVYVSAGQYFIIYTYEEVEPKILTRSARGSTLSGTMEINFIEGTGGYRPSVLRPKKVLVENPLRAYLDERPIGDEFYVYALGRLQGVFSNAVDGVTLAEELYGVVLTSTGGYVWERGNRYLVFDTFTEPFTISQGEDSRQALEDFMSNKDARRIDFTGANLIQMFYVINRGYPVITTFDGQGAVLLTGFTLEAVIYMDPRTGESYVRHFNEVNQMTRAGGNVFVGFIPE